MTCTHCREQMKYDPITFNPADTYGAQHAGKNAGAAFSGGHPGLAAAHLAFGVAKIVHKEFRRRTQSSYKCESCGRRS